MDVQVGHRLAQRGRRVGVNASEWQHHLPLLLTERVEERETEGIEPCVVSADDWTIPDDEAKIGRGPWTDIMNGEIVGLAIRCILWREKEKAKDDAAVAAGQRMYGIARYPAGITFRHEIFPIVHHHVQRTRDRLDQLNAIEAVGFQVDALASSDLDKHLVARGGAY